MESFQAVDAACLRKNMSVLKSYWEKKRRTVKKGDFRGIRGPRREVGVALYSW